MKELLKFIVGNIVAKKDEAKIEETEEEGFKKFRVSVSEDDMGRVIGKGGKVIKSIRTVLKIYSLKHGQKSYLELVDPQNSK